MISVINQVTNVAKACQSSVPWQLGNVARLIRSRACRTLGMRLYFRKWGLRDDSHFPRSRRTRRDRSGLRRGGLTVPHLLAFHLGCRSARLRNKGMVLSSYGLAGMVPVQDWGHPQSKTAHRSPHNLRTTDIFSLTSDGYLAALKG